MGSVGEWVGNFGKGREGKFWEGKGPGSIVSRKVPVRPKNGKKGGAPGPKGDSNRNFIYITSAQSYISVQKHDNTMRTRRQCLLKTTKMGHGGIQSYLHRD